MNKKNLDVYLCEPFILPGILPTLGVSTLKTMLTQNNISCEIYYSSLRFYINNKLPENIKPRCCNFKLLEEKCREYKNNK